MMNKMCLKISLISLFIFSQQVFAFKLNVKNHSDVCVIINVYVSTEYSQEHESFEMKPKTKISTNKFFEKDFERLVITPHQKDGELCSEDPSFDFKDVLPPSVYHWQEYVFSIKNDTILGGLKYSEKKESILLCRYDKNLTREEWNEKYRDLVSPFDGINWKVDGNEDEFTFGQTLLIPEKTKFPTSLSKKRCYALMKKPTTDKGYKVLIDYFAPQPAKPAFHVAATKQSQPVLHQRLSFFRPVDDLHQG